METNTKFPPNDGAIEILCVDDSPSDQALIAHALKGIAKPYRLACVSDGEVAIRYLRKQEEFATSPRPDLILLDLHFPKMHGHDVLREIREDEHLRDLAVMVLSTCASNDDVQKCHAFHANFFTKPQEFERFSVVLRAIDQFCEKLNQTKRSDISEEAVVKSLERDKEERFRERLELKGEIRELERKLKAQEHKVEVLENVIKETKNEPRLRDLLPQPYVLDPSVTKTSVPIPE